ncbi:MAG TPA: long-chain fatty acid--CoA ligase [Dermatophilaceae bacterium]|nr:long-chain fatty acid--CoA ligase [Dermatophilaceae bacterium]
MGLASVAQEVYDHDILMNRQPSVGHLFRERVRQTPDEDAFQYFVGEQLRHVSWAQVKDVVWSWAAGLICLGVQVEDRVAIASTTRYEWAVADLAVMCAGAATTTVYPTTLAADVAYLLADSASKVVFAEDAGQVEKLRSRREETPEVAKVVTFDPSAADGDWVISLDDLAGLGREVLGGDAGAVDARIDQLTPGHLATIIYTSGTTGRPKGAELTHDAIVYEGASVHALGILSEEDLQFLWLPLSHVFGKILLAIPMQVGFPTCIDGRIDKILDNLAVVRPTWMGAAPRIFEKAKARIGLMFAQETGAKAKLIEWALDVGGKTARDKEQARTSSPLLRVQHVLADRLVLGKVRARFGGRVRYFISGSAALDPDVARWFASVGLLIIEGYGLTETSAATTVNRPYEGSYSFGSIGWAVPGTEVKVDEDGELLIKGPGVMRGYHNQPEATAEAMTEDGYFRTGDIGHIDARGFIKITDRKKDVFKTSGGKYIAPSHIEAHFKGACPYVSQFVVIGEGRNYASALITLDPDAIAGWAEHQGMGGKPYSEIVSSPQAQQMVQGYIDELNAALNRWETIKRFSILVRDLTIDDGELTPSLKLKRKVVTEHFSDQVNGLYS